MGGGEVFSASSCPFRCDSWKPVPSSRYRLLFYRGASCASLIARSISAGAPELKDAATLRSERLMVIFDTLVNAHIVTGTTGLVAMWVPVFTRNGGPKHKLIGRVFVCAMLATGLIAIGISLCSLAYPLETHPPAKGFPDDIATLRGLFGWMMMYLGVLTVALAWHGYVTIRHKFDRAAYGTVFNVALQATMGLAAAWCAVFGLMIGQGIMVGVAVPGIAASILNGYYLVQKQPPHQEWLVQHFRASIGAGISVYTAFFAFGAVNWFPALAFNPVLWALPTVLGVGYMIKHQLRVFHQRVRTGRTEHMPFGRHLAAFVAVADGNGAIQRQNS